MPISFYHCQQINLHLDYYLYETASLTLENTLSAPIHNKLLEINDINYNILIFMRNESFCYKQFFYLYRVEPNYMHTWIYGKQLLKKKIQVCNGQHHVAVINQAMPQVETFLTVCTFFN